jgi:valyl-tRNA synthetase
MEQKRKLAVKFFNAAKFVFGIAGDKKPAAITNALDMGFLSGLADAAMVAKKSFLENDYANAFSGTEAAFWDFCDNYIEIVKGRAYAGDDSATTTLMTALEIFCVLFAPFMPFITEHAWSEKHDTSVHKEPWPDTRADGDGTYNMVSELVKQIRGKKTAANKSVKAPIKKLTVADNGLLRAAETDIKNVLNVEQLDFAGTELTGELTWAE